ncbi:MAG: thioredoxin-dependent thiol peroxidase [Nitrospiraceae bacterium]
MAKDIEVGHKAPDFSLPDQDGRKIRLRDLKGQQVVLYFYPKDNTPGCTAQACGLRDSLSSIKKTGGLILGVSLDGQESHQKFIAKFGLPFSLLSDEDATVSKTYGVYKLKNMYGKKYWGIERTTFIIDAESNVSAVFRKVKVDQHVEDVLVALRNSS